MSSNHKKNVTLGMPYGTAMGKLRKQVLFGLLKKHGENLCVRCKEPIEIVEDLSVEHIKPWEGISAALFWDLENVAFSHMRCNRPHRNPGPKIATPEGMAWCSRCQKPLFVSEFFKKTKHGDGLDNYCKKCRTEMDTRQNHTKKVSVAS